MSEDQFAGKYDNILSVNLYGYVGANPVNFVDPSGMVALTGDVYLDQKIKNDLLIYVVTKLVVDKMNPEPTIESIKDAKRRLDDYMTSDDYQYEGVPPIVGMKAEIDEYFKYNEDSDKSDDSDKDYTFPKSKNDIEEVFGVDSKTFHKKVKPEILKDVGKDKALQKELNKLGSRNPDIGVKNDGNIVLKNPMTGKTMETDLNIDWYLD